MTQPPLPSSRRELRKALVRLRLEMHRQEIRHEAQVITRPLRRVKGLAQGLQNPLGQGHAPLWGIAGIAALGFFAARGGSLARWVRLGGTLLPLLGALWKQHSQAVDRPPRP
ncbi:hypothetical protein WP8S17C03_17070 [Metapseudomonas otitidis]|uniref:YqjK-like protein n=1 Tax=Metapseudomonas otitidis TaxID=319939 RepID=A0A6S5RKK4_9GAMM|nr:hypothetical protein [Pseudomonas otitidis]BBT15658.1 hypothetical protein WP8S17C03_17070 [Pseudomonas otitidis]